MSGKRYSDEFKAEAAKQVIDQGRPAREVAARLGVSIHSMYTWVREQRKAPQHGKPTPRWWWRTGVCRPSSSG